MVKKIHKLGDDEHFKRMEASSRRLMDEMRGRLAIGEGKTELHLDIFCTRNVGLACIGLVFGRADDEVRRHFDEAAYYAMRWLRVPAWIPTLRTYDVELGVAEQSANVLAVHERRPNQRPRKLSLLSYGTIKNVIVAFGSLDDMREVARLPEEDYDNPDIVAAPSVYETHRAWRDWLLGDFASASRRIATVLRSKPTVMAVAVLSALDSLAHARVGDFRHHLEEILALHKKHYAHEPNDPEGVICMVGLDLCRLARDRGIDIPDGPYLPVRLLPTSAQAPR